jgi:hypothetical protein
MKYLLLFLLLTSSLYNLQAQNNSEYDLNEPFAFAKGQFIIGASYSYDDQEYGIYGRVFIADNLIFRGDALSIDYSFSYSTVKRQLLGTPAPLIIFAMWNPDYFTTTSAEGIGLRIVGTIIAPIIPEGVTYSHYIFNHAVHANLTLKPLQTAYYRGFDNRLRARAYSSIEGSLDLVIKEKLLITPFYSIGTEWRETNTHSYAGVKAGILF